MIINQLYIDEFSGHDDLTLEALASGLNVVRVPTAAEAAVLHAFIPSILVGPLREGDGFVPPLCGAIVAQVQGQSLDLCRLPADREGGCSDLQVLDADGRQVTAGPLHDLLKPFDARSYLALYTDCLPPAARLACWRTTGRLEELLDRSGSSSEQAIADTAGDRASAQQAQLQAALRSQLTELEQACHDLDQRLAVTSHQRAVYLEMRSQVRQHRERLRELDQCYTAT